MIEAIDLAHILKTNSGIEVDYRHKSKQVTPLDPLVNPDALLKWYGIHVADRTITDEMTQLARRYLLKIPLEAEGLGFVLPHRCGEDFYFLIVCTWRNSNELWETVFYKDGETMPDFVPFPRDGVHKPMLCVWEMVPAWHEQQAWTDFLNSPRDEAAVGTWVNNCFAGPA